MHYSPTNNTPQTRLLYYTPPMQQLRTAYDAVLQTDHAAVAASSGAPHTLVYNLPLRIYTIPSLI